MSLLIQKGHWFESSLWRSLSAELVFEATLPYRLVNDIHPIIRQEGHSHKHLTKIILWFYAVWKDFKFTLIFLGEFMCCGGYSYNMGYQDWKHTMLGGQFNSVPDSCCLKISNKCGEGVFRMTDQRRLVEQISTHGCITVMQRRLEDHVVVSF